MDLLIEITRLRYELLRRYWWLCAIVFTMHAVILIYAKARAMNEPRLSKSVRHKLRRGRLRSRIRQLAQHLRTALWSLWGDSGGDVEWP